MSIPRQTATFLDTESLKPHLENIREGVGKVHDLIASIQEHGIMQPLVVTEHPATRGAYLILAGHRRHTAAIKLGLPKVPCVIRHDQGADTEKHIALMFVENTHRRGLTPIEKARAIGKLLAGGENGRRTHREVARMTGISPSQVSAYATFLELDDRTMSAVEDGAITAGEARNAVRQDRARRRQSSGSGGQGRPVILEPPYFAPSHPLASTVKRMCDHSTRSKVGTVGCGQCWEAAIINAATVGGGA